MRVMQTKPDIGMTYVTVHVRESERCIFKPLSECVFMICMDIVFKPFCVYIDVF